MLNLLTLPFRLFFGLLCGVLLLPLVLLVLPFLLLRFAIKAAVAVVVLPFILLATMIGFVVAAVAALLPLLPFAIVAFCVWLLMRRSQAAIAVRD